MADAIKVAAERGSDAAVEHLADFLNAVDAVESGDAETYELWKRSRRVEQVGWWARDEGTWLPDEYPSCFSSDRERPDGFVPVFVRGAGETARDALAAPSPEQETRDV
jgi:hypothetical protein